LVGFLATLEMPQIAQKKPFRRKSIVTNRRAATLNANGENDGHTHSVSGLLGILES
jgi:hypothetical protein